MHKKKKIKLRILFIISMICLVYPLVNFIYRIDTLPSEFNLWIYWAYNKNLIINLIFIAWIGSAINIYMLGHRDQIKIIVPIINLVLNLIVIIIMGSTLIIVCFLQDQYKTKNNRDIISASNLDITCYYPEKEIVAKDAPGLSYILLPVGKVKGLILENTAEIIKEVSGLPCKILSPMPLKDEYLYKESDQYDGFLLLKKLEQIKDNQQNCFGLLAITEVDLTAKDFNWTFCPSKIGKFVSIVSTYRLRQEFYGLINDEKLFIERLKKLILRAFIMNNGRRICTNSYCAGHYCSSIRVIDKHILGFCPSCRKIIYENFRPINLP